MFGALILNPRLWLALAVAAALAVSHGWAYRRGEAAVQARWDAERATQVKQQLEAEHEARRIENARETLVAAAQSDARKREAALRRDAERARSELDGLRNAANAAATGGVSEDSLAACRHDAAALAGVLGELGAEAQELARAADGHASDVKMLIKAWPK